MTSSHSVDDARIAFRVFPVEFIGWWGNRILVPSDYLGVFCVSYAASRVVTGGTHSLPFEAPFSFQWGWGNREFGLVSQSFVTEVFLPQLETQKPNIGSKWVVDYYSRVRLIIKREDAGKFYNQFVAGKSEIRDKDVSNAFRGSLFASEIGQILSHGLKKSILFQRISEYTRRYSADELINDKLHRDHLEYEIGTAIHEIAREWGASAFINGKILLKKRGISDTRPLLPFGPTSDVQKQDSIRIQKVSWANRLNDAFQLSQLILGIFIIFAGLMDIHSLENLFSSYWTLGITVFVIWVIMLIGSRPLIRTMATMENRRNFPPPIPRPSPVPAPRPPDSPISFKFWRPALMLTFAIWATFDTLSTGWWPNFGLLMAAGFFLLYLVIQDNWYVTYLPRLIPAMIPFLILAWQDDMVVKIYALACSILIFVLVMIWTVNEKDEVYLLIGLSVIFTPILVRSGGAFYFPLIIGFLVSDKLARISMAFLSSILAFSLGYFQIHQGAKLDLIIIQTGLQAMVWVTTAWAVGMLVDRNIHFHEDLITVVVGMAILFLGLSAGHSWLQGQAVLPMRNWLFESTVSTVAILILGVFPRAITKQRLLV